MLLWTQSGTNEHADGKRDKGSGKCRQNSNLLITYLFFTFFREQCGGGGGWQRLPKRLPLDTGLLSRGGDKTLRSSGFSSLDLTNQNCISQSFSLNRRGERSPPCFVHVKTFNPYAQFTHINLQSSRPRPHVKLVPTDSNLIEVYV